MKSSLALAGRSIFLYYGHELKIIGALAVTTLLIGLLSVNSTAFLQRAASAAGIIVQASLWIAIILCLAIKIYYRVIIIKYQNKNA